MAGSVLGSAMRAARDARTTPAPEPTPTSTLLPSPTPLRGGRRIVLTSSLRRRPPSLRRATTAAEFYRDPATLTSTPIEEGRENEYADQSAYAFSYAEDLATLLESHGFTKASGLTLDTQDAEADFAVLITCLSHILSPVSHAEFAMLRDLEHKYEAYHVVLNEIIFAGLWYSDLRIRGQLSYPVCHPR